MANFHDKTAIIARQGKRELDKFRCNGRTDVVDLRTIAISYFDKLLDLSRESRYCKGCLISRANEELAFKVFNKRKPSPKNGAAKKLGLGIEPGPAYKTKVGKGNSR